MPYDQEYIKARVVVDDDGCWVWQLSKDRNGYACVSKASGESLAHRLAWRVFRGDPNGLCVLHLCDFPSCVNPDHLFLGTQTDNLADMTEKGRRYQTQSLLTEEEWRLVDHLLSRGAKATQIANHFGFNPSIIYSRKYRAKGKDHEHA